MIFQNTQKPKTPKRLLVVNYFWKSYINLWQHIRSPPWEDWKGGLSGLLKTLGRTARGIISTILSVNYLSRHSKNGEDDRHLCREEGATGKCCIGNGLRIIHQECLQFLPSGAGQDGRKIGLCQLHTTIGSNCLFHIAKILLFPELSICFV